MLDVLDRQIKTHTRRDLDTKTWLQERVDGRAGLVLGAAWFVLFNVAMALEPATSRSEPAIGVVLALAFWLLIGIMAAGFVMERRFGMVASLAAATFFTMLSIACPVTGHHPFGAWWFGQMACALTLMGLSVAALSRAERDRPLVGEHQEDVPESRA